MPSVDPGDENITILSPRKPRPLGFHAKSTPPQDSNDLKAIISSPFGLSMGGVGFEIAGGMALRRSSGLRNSGMPMVPHNLVLEQIPPLPLGSLDNSVAVVRTATTARIGRKHTVLSKPSPMSTNVSPSRLPTKVKVVSSVTSHRTRDSQAFRTPRTPPRKRATRHVGSECGTHSVGGLSHAKTSPVAQLPSLSTRLAIVDYSIYSRSNPATTTAPPVPSLPTVAITNPSTDQYESLLSSAPSLEALFQSDHRRTLKFPSFGSVKRRAKDPRIANAFSAPPLVVPAATFQTIDTRSGDFLVASDLNTQVQFSAEPYCHRTKTLTRSGGVSHLSSPPHSLEDRPPEQQTPEVSSSTMKLDAFGIQTDSFPSLLCSTSSLRGLAEEPFRVSIISSGHQHTSSHTSFLCKDLKAMSFGSVKPRSDLRASIGASAVTSQTSLVPLTSSEPLNNTRHVGNGLLLADESPSFAVDFTSPGFLTPEDYAKNKHERLLAAILDITPAMPDITEKSSLPFLVSYEEQDLQRVQIICDVLHSTSCICHTCGGQQRSSLMIDVPAIVVTNAVEGEQGIICSSSSFSIVDLYVGRPELPYLGSGSKQTIDPSNLDQAWDTSQGISKVNGLRNSVSFPDEPTDQRLSTIAKSRLDKRRGSFLSPGLPSSFLSMSAINEDGGRKRGSLYTSGASGLKGLFRRSSKASLVSNSRDRGRRASRSLRKGEQDSRRVSGWGLFKWMKG